MTLRTGISLHAVILTQAIFSDGMTNTKKLEYDVTLK